MVYKIGSVEVVQRPAISLDSQFARYSPHKPSTTLLPKGFQKAKELLPFKASTIFEKDVTITLRDGTKLFADIFRPEGDAKVPVILCWSPYGKTGTGFYTLDIIPRRVGIPLSWNSGFEKFEAPDPAEWTSRGYAVINIDSRGAFDSQGDIVVFGSQEGRDGYDAIEEIAQFPWCDGGVTLVGNSWLAVAQYFIAAERPPHLKCIAPLEGMSDVYRETICRGGVPNLGFWEGLSQTMFGRNQQEDIVETFHKNPLMNDYWRDKRAKFENIEVPAYILGSYSTGLHSQGSCRAFEDIPGKNKWLRIHPTQEWHDLYQTSTNDDLQKFLDYFMKDDKSNGWNETPRVRFSVLRYNQSPLVNLPFASWPIPDTEYRQLHLAPNQRLVENCEEQTNKESYPADVPCLQMDSDPGEISFSYTFSERTLLAGYPRCALHMSCASHDDMDVCVIIRKADALGKVLRNINMPLTDLGATSEDEVELFNALVYAGPTGILRASHRTIDPDLSKPYWPVHPHDKVEKVKPGTVVRLEMVLTPMGIMFEPGEKLVFRISGHHMMIAELENLRGVFKADNHGSHDVWFGGSYDSYVVLPVVRYG